jgi:alpha-beta hydrolase superfamily lysophospholipase
MMALWVTIVGCAVPLPDAYGTTGSWRAVHDALPAAQQLADDELPEETVWTWREHRVHLDVVDPTGTPRGTVVLVHGGGGNGRLLATFARPLAAAGFRVVAPDLPGFGLTEVPRGSPPRFATWVDLVADLACEEADRAGLPVGTYGMSLGGTVALQAAMRCDAIDGVAVTTLLDLQDRDTLKAIAKTPSLVPVLRGPLGALASGMRMRVRGIAPLDAMSSDAAINAALAEDSLVGRRPVKIGFFRSLGLTEPPVPVSEMRPVPVLVAHPAADTWTAPALSRPTFDALPGPKQWVDLDGAHHLPIEQPGRDQLDTAVSAHFRSALAGER